MSSRNSVGWEILGFLLLGGAVAVGLFAAFSHWAYDDPFITFRYAENLRSGLGFVYNPGERVLSTTTPLYALLLAGLSFIWPDLPRLSNLIGTVSLVSGGLALYTLSRRVGEPLAGLFMAVLYPFFPLMLSTLGAETCFYVMLILWAFALHAAGRYLAAMSLAALATLTRADGVLVAVVLGIEFLVRKKRVPWRSLVLFGLLIAPWFLFAWVYFGSPFPVTLMAKQHQAQMAISESFAQGFVRLIRGYGSRPLYWLHGGLAIVGLGYAVSKARRWLALLGWGVLYFSSYVLLGVSRYFWYYAPLVPPFLVLVGLGAGVLVHWGRKWIGRKWALWLISVVSLFLLGLPQANSLIYLRTHPDPRANIYRDVGVWLAENTPADASIGALEVGIIGYYARRRMIDFAGLIQPDVALQMKHETTYQDTALWAVRRYRPDYLVLDPNWFPQLMQQEVNRACIPVQRFTRVEYPGALVVFACK